MHGARVHSVLMPLWNSGYSWQEAVLKAFRLLEHWAWALGEKKSALQVDKQREQLISPLMFSHFCCRFVLSLFLFSASNASFAGRESPGLKSAL